LVLVMYDAFWCWWCCCMLHIGDTHTSARNNYVSTHARFSVGAACCILMVLHFDAGVLVLHAAFWWCCMLYFGGAVFWRWCVGAACCIFLMLHFVGATCCILVVLHFYGDSFWCW
jgi:hypothetical protein